MVRTRSWCVNVLGLRIGALMLFSGYDPCVQLKAENAASALPVLDETSCPKPHFYALLWSDPIPYTHRRGTRPLADCPPRHDGGHLNRCKP